MQLDTLNSHNNVAIVTYDTQGHRMALTTRLVARWIGKCAHALRTLDIAPGSPFTVALPPHWRAVVWTLGAWYAGHPVAFHPGSLPLNCLLTHSLTNTPEADNTLAQTLHPLALAWPTELPWDVEDAAQLANSQPDLAPPPTTTEWAQLLSPTQLTISKHIDTLIRNAHPDAETTVFDCTPTAPTEQESTLFVSSNDTQVLCLLATHLWQLNTSKEQTSLPPRPLVIIPANTTPDKQHAWISQETQSAPTIICSPEKLLPSQ